MLRNVGWVLANIGIAAAIVACGTAVVLLLDPDEPGGLADALGGGLLAAIFFAPWYLPGVVFHLLATTLLSRRIRERVAALALAPLAPCLLWTVLFVDGDAYAVVTFLAGVAAYGALVRLPGTRPTRALLAAIATVVGGIMLVLVFPVGLALIGLALLAAWLLHRDSRAGVAAR